MTERTARAGTWSLVAAAFLAVMAAELRRRSVDPSLPALTAATLSGIAFSVLGALVLHRRPAHGLGRLYLGIGLLLAAFALTNVRASVAIAVWFNSWAWLVAPVLLLTFGTFLLPDGRIPPGRPGRWAARTSVAAVGTALVALPYDLQPTPPPLGPWLPTLPPAVTGAAVGAALALAVLSIVLSVASVFQRYRRAGVLDRQRLRWIAFCTVLAVALYVAGPWLTLVPGVSWDLIMAGVVLLPAIGVSVSIVRHRMFDIDRLLARTVSYAVVTVVVVGIYLAAVVAVTAVVPSASDGDLVIAVSTLGAAAAFRPVRRRVQALVDRRFHRSRYDAVGLVAAFAARLRDEIDLETVAGELVVTSSASLRPASVSLWTATSVARGNASGTLLT